MIIFENVTKKFGLQEAVKNLNLQIEKGELFGFLGPNGAGKTTTIKMIVGLVNPTSGRIKISGKYVDEKGRKIGTADPSVAEIEGGWRMYYASDCGPFSTGISSAVIANLLP